MSNIAVLKPEFEENCEIIKGLAYKFSPENSSFTLAQYFDFIDAPTLEDFIQ